MIQSESLNLGCVCPQCLMRCNACMGTNTVISREALRSGAFERLRGAAGEAAYTPPPAGTDFAAGDADEPDEMDGIESGPLRPDEMID